MSAPSARRIERLQDRGWQVLNGAKIRTRVSTVVNWLLLVLIFLNVVAVTLETVPSLNHRFADAFWWFEVVSVIVFGVEYLFRLWCVPAGPRVIERRLQAARARGDHDEAATLRVDLEEETGSRLAWMLSPMSLVDLFAILPTFFPAFIALDMRFLRALRLLRFFRLLKVARYTRSLRRFRLVLREKREELVLSMFVMLLCLLFASSLMYYVERDAQPDKFASIPEAMWWAVAALSTVGYGDVTPITPLGRFLGAVIAMIGIGLFGLPAGILASGFMAGLGREERQGEAVDADPQPDGGALARAAPPPGCMSCPHCGGGIALQTALVAAGAPPESASPGSSGSLPAG